MLMKLRLALRQGKRLAKQFEKDLQGTKRE